MADGSYQVTRGFAALSSNFSNSEMLFSVFQTVIRSAGFAACTRQANRLSVQVRNYAVSHQLLYMIF